MTKTWTDDWFEGRATLPRLFVVVGRDYGLTLFDAERNQVSTNPAWNDIGPCLTRLSQHIRWEHGPEWQQGVVFDTLRAGDVTILVRLPVPLSAWRNLVDDVPQYQRWNELQTALQADQYQRVIRVTRSSTTGADALHRAQRYFFTDALRKVNASVPWRFDQTQDEFITDDL